MENIDFEFSRFNIIKKVNDKYFIYNTISNVLISISDSEFYLLKNYPNKYIREFLNDDVSFLISNKILANDNSEIKNIQLEKYDELDFDKTLDVMIHPTLECNLKCRYCFQLSNNLGKMNYQTAINIFRNVKEYVSKNKINNINITWSGGEPLLGLDKIILISGLIKAELPHTNLLIDMITNGLLLTYDNLLLLQKINVKKIQISIDSMCENEDEKRTIYNKDGSLSKIANNIDELIMNFNSIHTVIRVNINKKNEMDFSLIVKYFSDKYRHKNYSIYPEFIENYNNNNNNNNNNTLTSKDRIRFYKRNYDYIDETNFNKKNRGCIKTRKSSWAIGPDGSFYNCELEVGDKRKSTNDSLKKPYVLKEECKQCVLLPVCNFACGQCHFMKGNEQEIINLKLLSNTKCDIY